MQAISLSSNTATKKETIIELACAKHPHNPIEVNQVMEDLSRDMWSIPCAKTEGEAEEKLDACHQGEGFWAYLRIHLWFTCTFAQGRSLRRAAIMNPSTQVQTRARNF